ncbi:alpha/beta hydrolase family protein [Ferrimonas pelagia]|uniref:Alpha/beta fold hydrolase n=1 Tax=Ferrimonas pelagia TaxID=1177826 RepID=A0ABP9EBY6_9GAMM
MKSHSERLICADHQPLIASWHQPEGKPKAAILIGAALGVARGFYHDFARYLAGQGFLVLSFDYRGVGESRIAGQRDDRVQMACWAEQDLPAALKALQRKAEGLPLHYIGHSCGGQLLGMVPGATAFQTVTLVGASVPYWKHYNSIGLLSGLKMWLNWHLFLPLLSLGKKFPARTLGLSKQDMPSGIIRQWARWGRQRDYLFADDHPALVGYERLTMPLLNLGFADDTYAPPSAVLDLADRYTNAFQESRIISGERLEQLGGIGHFGFFNEAKSQPLWQEWLAWMAQHR